MVKLSAVAYHLHEVNGTWTYEDETFYFSEDSDANKYNTLMEAFLEVTERQQKIIEKQQSDAKNLMLQNRIDL